MWLHRPFNPADGPGAAELFYPELREMLRAGARSSSTADELGDGVTGSWPATCLGGLVARGPRAISIMEQITHRHSAPSARELVRSAWS